MPSRATTDSHDQGRVLAIRQARRQYFDAGRVIREAFLKVPDRIAPTLAALDDPQQLVAVLHNELVAVLYDVSDELLRLDQAAEAVRPRAPAKPCAQERVLEFPGPIAGGGANG